MFKLNKNNLGQIDLVTFKEYKLFLVNGPILYPLKNQKTFDFLVFLGGINCEYWLKRDLKSSYNIKMFILCW